MSAYRLCYRPEVMLYLAMAGTLWALERRWLLLLPALAFGLTLFHPSALVLLLIVGCHLVDAIFTDRRYAAEARRGARGRRRWRWCSRPAGGTPSCSR